MRIVNLLAAVVGLNDNVIGSWGNVAGGPDFGMQGGGDVLQQALEGHLQCSFRIDSCGHLEPRLPSDGMCVLVHVLSAGP